MANKKPARKQARGAILSVAPITSREELGATKRRSELLRALKARYDKLCRYEPEIKQLAAAIKALGGKLNG